MQRPWRYDPYQAVVSRRYTWQDALEHVESEVRGFRPNGSYQALFERFQGQVSVALQSLKGIKLSDDQEWNSLAHNLFRVSAVCSAAEYTRVMPRLFSAIQSPIDIHLREWAHQASYQAREACVVSLMQALGRGLMALQASEYEGYLGPYSGYTMMRIGMWLAHAT